MKIEDKNKRIRVGYAQTSPKFGEKQKNFKQVEQIIGNKQMDLLVLPELFATGYTFVSKQETAELAERTPGETSTFLENIAKKIDGVVVGGFIEKDGNKLFNSAMMVDSSGIKTIYRKIHLFNKEKLWFVQGDLPFSVIKLVEKKGVKVGIMICFDWIFPEAARTLALRGADIIAHPANLVLPYCQNAMITRSISNRVFSITCNRIGNEVRSGKHGEDDFLFTGGSQILDQKGHRLKQASKARMDLGIADIDFSLARNKSLNNFNHVFDDRREKYYE